MVKRIVIAVGVVGVLALAVDSLLGSFLGMLAGTTTDPRSMGLMQSANMAPVRATLKTDILMDKFLPGDGQHRSAKGDYRLTFEAPAAYYSAIGKPSSRRGEQVVAFNFWSKSGDSVGPDLIADRRLCGRGTPCTESPLRKRQEAGEWQVEVEMFNAVDTPAEQLRLSVDQLNRARSVKEACTIYDDAKLGLTVVTVPQADYPDVSGGHVRKPNFCGGVYIYQGDISSYRGGGIYRGSPWTYYPPSIFYKFEENGDFRFRVDCGQFMPASADRPSNLCTMGIRFGSWSGRVWVSPVHIADWEKAHSDIMKFLTRHVVSRTID